MKRTQTPRRRTAFLFIAFIVCATILGTLLYRKYQTGKLSPPPSPPREQAGTTLVTLFFAEPTGDGLKREVREIEACEDPVACVESVIEELANGPLGDLEPTLPPSFSVREVQIVDDTAVVDLEKGSQEGLPEGSSAEMTAIYSIVDSIAFNFPRIRSVRFLVGGETVPTLKGHVDLRNPLSADFTLEKSGPRPAQREDQKGVVK